MKQYSDFTGLYPLLDGQLDGFLHVLQELIDGRSLADGLRAHLEAGGPCISDQASRRWLASSQRHRVP